MAKAGLEMSDPAFIADLDRCIAEWEKHYRQKIDEFTARLRASPLPEAENIQADLELQLIGKVIDELKWLRKKAARGKTS